MTKVATFTEIKLTESTKKEIFERISAFIAKGKLFKLIVVDFTEEGSSPEEILNAIETRNKTVESIFQEILIEETGPNEKTKIASLAIDSPIEGDQFADNLNWGDRIIFTKDSITVFEKASQELIDSEDKSGLLEDPNKNVSLGKLFQIHHY